MRTLLWCGIHDSKAEAVPTPDGYTVCEAHRGARPHAPKDGCHFMEVLLVLSNGIISDPHPPDIDPSWYRGDGPAQIG